MDSVYGDGGLLRRVSPFRHLRVLGYLLLSAAFRSLSRLSSALSAKASSLRSFQLILLGLLLYSVTGLPAWFFPACCCFAFWRLSLAPASDVFPISSSSAFRPPQTFLIFQISFNVQFSRYGRIRKGSSGDREIRTLDPLLARQVLSQLSYAPMLRQPPALPCRLQHSTIGRTGLNRRVRDGNGCAPCTHRRRNLSLSL